MICTATKDFERQVALRKRTEAIATNLSEFLKKTDRFAKTIVLCVDQEHAEEMRKALNNQNLDLAKQHPDYVARIVSDEGSKAPVGGGNPVVSRSNRSENSEPPERLLNRRDLFCRAWILFGRG